MNRNILAISGLLGLLLLAGGCTTTPERQQYKGAPVTMPKTTPQLEVRDQISATAIVQAVNLEKREVVLKGKGGKLYTVAVGEEVRNLPQVKAGDRVELTYYEALALSVEKNKTKSAPSRQEAVTVNRAPLGQKPAGTVRKEIEIVADVTAINQKNRRVSLLGTQDAVTLKVPEDIDISTLKVGDQVRANYAQELAISVEPAGKKKKK